MELNIEERFWRNVLKRGPEECWLWVGCKRDNGYGRFYRDGKARTAHRVAYALAFGEIPSGLCALHRCDVRACCNPAHLWLGTKAENNTDMVTKGRHVASRGEKNGARLHPERLARGESNGLAKLTESAIREIRLRRSECVPLRVLAAQFNTDFSNVGRIASRQTWKHVS